MAEIILEAPSLGSYRQASLELICRTLSLDSAAINHLSPSGEIEVMCRGLSTERLQAALPSYMREISAEEFGRALGGRMIPDERIFAGPRRSSLGVYTEYLNPSGIFTFCARMWSSRSGCSWMTFSRAGRSVQYPEHDLHLFDAMSSLARVGEAFHQREATRPGPSDARASWNEDKRITPAEDKVISLVERGLTNAEIGAVLGRSMNTVRNQLAGVFQKVQVSTRTELLFVLRESERGRDMVAMPTSAALVELFRRRQSGSRQFDLERSTKPSPDHTPDIRALMHW